MQSLASAEAIDASAEIERSDEGPTVYVKLANRGKQLAFQLHLGVTHKDREAEILPVLWRDNYIELMPGESREITAQFLSADALNEGAQLRLTGWNIATQTIALTQPPVKEDAGGKR